MAEFVTEQFSVDTLKFTTEEIQRFKDIFQVVDADNDGTVSHGELYNMFETLGYEVTPELIVNLVATVDVDNSGNLSFDEFVSLIVLVKSFLESNQNEQSNEVFVEDLSSFSPETLAKFKEIFDAVDADNDGTVSHGELYNMFEILGYEVTPELIVNLVATVDADNSGNLSFDEFVSLVSLVNSALNQNAKSVSLISDEDRERFLELFRTVDIDGSGTINNSELGGLFEALGYEATIDELNGLIAIVDDDQNGVLSFDEFVELIVLFLKSHQSQEEEA